MRLSARVDYALRAVLELAGTDESPLTAERIARAQDIPPKFCESILLQLRRGGIVSSQRGPDGGYWLARPADQISLADIVEAIDGPLGSPARSPAQSPLQQVWVALEEAERRILSEVQVSHVVRGELPGVVTGIGAAS